MFNIGISSFQIYEGLGSKGYRAVVLYEGYSQSMFTSIGMYLYWLCAVVVWKCGFKKGPVFEPMK